MTATTIRQRAFPALKAYQLALALALALGYALVVTGYVAAGQFFHRAAAPTPDWSKPLSGVHAYKVQRGYGTSDGMTCDLSIYTTNKAALDGRAKLHPGRHDRDGLRRPQGRRAQDALVVVNRLARLAVRRATARRRRRRHDRSGAKKPRINAQKSPVMRLRQRARGGLLARSRPFRPPWRARSARRSSAGRTSRSASGRGARRSSTSNETGPSPALAGSRSSSHARASLRYDVSTRQPWNVRPFGLYGYTGTSPFRPGRARAVGAERGRGEVVRRAGVAARDRRRARTRRRARRPPGASLAVTGTCPRIHDRLHRLVRELLGQVPGRVRDQPGRPRPRGRRCRPRCRATRPAPAARRVEQHPRLDDARGVSRGCRGALARARSTRTAP